MVVFSRIEEALFSDFAQFAGKRVAFFEKARFQRALTRQYPEIDWMPFQSPKQALAAVSTGQATGGMANLFVGTYLIREYGYSNLKVALPVPSARTHVSFAVHPDNEVLATLLSKALAAMSTAEHKAIRDAWLPTRFEHGWHVSDILLWVGFVAGVLIAVLLVVHRSRNRLLLEMESREKAQAELARATERFHCAIEAMSDGFVIFDSEDRLVIFNDVYRRLRPDIADLLKPGAKREDLLREGVRRRFPDLSDEELAPMFEERQATLQGSKGGEITSASGRWMRVNTYPMSDGGSVSIRTDITDLKRTEEALEARNKALDEMNVRLQNLANHDQLTGLANRRLFHENLVQAIKYAKRRMERFGLLMIDLDKFKIINDTLGHQAGDEALCEAGRRISGTVRNADIVARLGGDEFAILTTAGISVDGAIVLARKVLAAVDQPLILDGNEFELRCSIGISVYPDHGTEAETVLKNADSAMYFAKRNQFKAKLYSFDSTDSADTPVMQFGKTANGGI